MDWHMATMNEGERAYLAAQGRQRQHGLPSAIKRRYDTIPALRDWELIQLSQFYKVIYYDVCRHGCRCRPSILLVSSRHSRLPLMMCFARRLFEVNSGNSFTPS